MYGLVPVSPVELYVVFVPYTLSQYLGKVSPQRERVTRAGCSVDGE